MSAPTKAVREPRESGAVDDSCLAPTYQRPDVLFVRGQGCWLEDQRGRRFLDLTGGIAVNALGHASSVVQDALREGAAGLIHVSNLYHTAPALELARDLVRRCFAQQVFFCNSGTEASEAAIKFARLAGGPGRRHVVYFEGSFHGRSYAALSATDRADARRPFRPLVPGFRRAAWNDRRALPLIDEHTAAVLLEPVQGESGVRVPSEDWLRAVRARCDEVGALLVFDEVQCGLGRTGHLFAHQGLGVEPDMMTLAKPLAGGLPMGAVLLGARLRGVVRPGCHGSTFGGGPLVATVARRILAAVAEPSLLEDVRRKGERLRAALRALPGVEEVRGRGLMVGVRVAESAAVHAAAFEEELLLVPAGDQVLRFLPPLNITDQELDLGVERFARALEAGRARAEEATR